MKNLLDTKTANLSEILGNGKRYKIPDFQRDYSWEAANWDDLWNDIALLEIANSPHYMGTIVLQSTNEINKFIVVDGQQRLTTMSIFVLSVVGFLENLAEIGIDVESNKERIRILKDKYVGNKSATSLFYITKIELNENNDKFYKQYITENKKPNNLSKLRDSEKLIYKAYCYFLEKITKKFVDSGKNATEFLENTVSIKLVFIQITVDDDLSAYTVFETLNARGVELTTTDLLKNYLFSIAVRETSDSQLLKDDWKEIIDLVGLKDFPNFLRYFFNSKNNLIRHSDLFKAIKEQVKDTQQVYNLLNELKNVAYLYIAIKNPVDEFWNENPHKREIEKSLGELKLFDVTQPIPLLFACYEFLPEIFHKVLNIVSIVSFRFNIIAKKNPNELEVKYNDIAKKISNNIVDTKQQIIDELSDIYVTDTDFENLFRNKEMNSNGKSKKIVKYILTKIENQISNTEYQSEDSTFTIEHILPENYTDEWKSKFGNDIKTYIYKLGNYSILKDTENKIAGNKTFNEKKQIYKRSAYKLSNEYINFDDWNPSTLLKRQDALTKIAKGIWRIS